MLHEMFSVWAPVAYETVMASMMRWAICLAMPALEIPEQITTNSSPP